jgi:hypothetical protein
MNLFLDDIRQPYEVGNYISPIELRVFYRKEQWEIVRNYKEFCEFISKNGLPELISFDHDLADEHYTPQEYWHNYEVSKAYQESQNYKEKTGMDCAKWLVDYCIVNSQPLPKFFIHSMNPVGAENIRVLLNNFQKHQLSYNSYENICDIW